MTSNFIPEVVIWSKLRMRSENRKKDEEQRRTAKISRLRRKSMLLNPFPVTDLPRECT